MFEFYGDVAGKEYSDTGETICDLWRLHKVETSHRVLHHQKVQYPVFET